jgi:hypothetical protein
MAMLQVRLQRLQVFENVYTDHEKRNDPVQTLFILYRPASNVSSVSEPCKF